MRIKSDRVAIININDVNDEIDDDDIDDDDARFLATNATNIIVN